MRDVQLGEQVDAVRQRLDVDVAGGRDQLHAGLLDEKPQRFTHAGKQAAAACNGHILPRRDRDMLIAGQVRGTRTGGADACRTGQHKHRLRQFGKLAALVALDRVVLRADRCCGVALVLLRVLGARVLGRVDQVVMQIPRTAEPRATLRHVLDVRAGTRPRFGRDQHTLAGTQHTPCARRELKTFAAHIHAAGVVFDTADVPE